MEESFDFEDLIRKLQEESLTHEETAFLLTYLKSREPGTDAEEFFKKIWNESIIAGEVADSKWLLERINDKITGDNKHISGTRATDPGDGNKFRSENFKRYLIPMIRYAAVFILGFTFFWLIKPESVNKEQVASADTYQFQQVTVPYGSKTKVNLPDGSTVTLNSGSDLSYYSAEFNKERRTVLLSGEGFFEVKTDPSRPFYVNTPGIKVKALGTTFNLKAYPDEDIEEMMLLSGSVEIYLGTDLKEEKAPVILKPNEKVIFIKTEQKIRKQETIPEKQTGVEVRLSNIKLQSDEKAEQIISWKDNRMIFDNEPFSSLVARIERWYDVRITVNYPELNNARFSGKFDNETVEQVMNALSVITPFGYEINRNQITITKK